MLIISINEPDQIQVQRDKDYINFTINKYLYLNNSKYDKQVSIQNK